MSDLHFGERVIVSTHSRLKAAGACYFGQTVFVDRVSTHSRLKAAGFAVHRLHDFLEVSTHSRLKAAGGRMSSRVFTIRWFQHTAA